MSEFDYDLCVVGAGLIGSAAAKHASQLSPSSVCLIGPSEPKISIFVCFYFFLLLSLISYHGDPIRHKPLYGRCIYVDATSSRRICVNTTSIIVICLMGWFHFGSISRFNESHSTGVLNFYQQNKKKIRYTYDCTNI